MKKKEKKKKKNLSVYDKKKKICQKYPDKYNMDMCLAKKRTKGGKNKRCTKKALRSTGRCKLHGGVNYATIKSGKYSKYFKDKIREKYEYFRRDPHILELKDEIAILRSLVVESREAGDPEDPKLNYIIREQVARLCDMVTKNIEKAYKIKGAVITIEAIPILIRQFINMTSETLSVCPHCKGDLKGKHKELYAKMLEARAPTADWPGNAGNEIIEAEFKVVK